MIAARHTCRYLFLTKSSAAWSSPYALELGEPRPDVFGKSEFYSLERLPRPVPTSTPTATPSVTTMASHLSPGLALTGHSKRSRSAMSHCRAVTAYNGRRPPQELVACCSSFTPSIVCVTERVNREHGIMPDGAADAPAAPGVVADVWDSRANVLSSQRCM